MARIVQLLVCVKSRSMAEPLACVMKVPIVVGEDKSTWDTSGQIMEGEK